MQKIIILFLGAVFISSCNQAKPDTTKAEQEIIKADKDMSELAAKEGFIKALLQYADDEVVIFREGKLPVIGRKAYADSTAGKEGTKSLTWEPVKAVVAQSGELGYTWGNWKLAKQDTMYYGNYFTVWKKQADGSWKFALDGGNATPAPDK